MILPKRLASSGFLVFALASCGTYRTGSGNYNGMGNYKNPSDYSSGVDSSDYSKEDTLGSRGRLGKRTQYFPRGPFKLNWPLTLVHINRGFQAIDTKHDGLDLGGRKGVTVMAAHEGVVIYAGRDFHGYGKMILVEYNKEWATLYAHLDAFIAKEGQVVSPGDPIGTMGATGDATGVHLHFEVFHNREPTDPIPLLTRANKVTSAKMRAHKIVY